MRQFSRFLVVGVFNTFFGYIVIFALMYLAGLTPEISNIGGYAVGLTTSYILNRYYTFSSKQSQQGEMVRFVLVFMIAYAANFVVLLALIHEAELHGGISQLMAGFVYVVASYILNKYYVFNQVR